MQVSIVQLTLLAYRIDCGIRIYIRVLLLECFYKPQQAYVNEKFSKICSKRQSPFTQTNVRQSSWKNLDQIFETTYEIIKNYINKHWPQLYQFRQILRNSLFLSALQPVLFLSGYKRYLKYLRFLQEFLPTLVTFTPVHCFVDFFQLKRGPPDKISSLVFEQVANLYFKRIVKPTHNTKYNHNFLIPNRTYF